MTFSPSYPGMISMYFLNESFLNHETFSIYVHSESSSDLYDSVFAIENRINFAQTKVITAVFTPVTHRRLPPPFDTMCRMLPGSLTGGEILFRKLNRITMAQLGHVHTLEHVYERYQYPMITPFSLKNTTFHDQFMDLKLKTFGTSSFAGCTFVYNVPQTMSQEGERIGIVLNWPQDSGIEVDSVPNQETIDFLIYILSSIGIWFGWSILSILSSSEKRIIRRIKRGKQEEKVELTKCIIIRDCDTVLRWQMYQMKSQITCFKKALLRIENKTECR